MNNNLNHKTFRLEMPTTQPAYTTCLRNGKDQYGGGYGDAYWEIGS